MKLGLLFLLVQPAFAGWVTTASSSIFVNGVMQSCADTHNCQQIFQNADMLENFQAIASASQSSGFAYVTAQKATYHTLPGLVTVSADSTVTFSDLIEIRGNQPRGTFTLNFRFFCSGDNDFGTGLGGYACAGNAPGTTTVSQVYSFTNGQAFEVSFTIHAVASGVLAPLCCSSGATDASAEADIIGYSINDGFQGVVYSQSGAIGQTPLALNVLGGSTQATVPEPGTWLLVLPVIAVVLLRRPGRNRGGRKFCPGSMRAAASGK